MVDETGTTSTAASRESRWEIVRTAAGFHIRFVAANGEIVVSGETLSARADALNAIQSVAQRPVGNTTAGLVVMRLNRYTEIREVDER